MNQYESIFKAKMRKIAFLLKQFKQIISEVFNEEARDKMKMFDEKN